MHCLARAARLAPSLRTATSASASLHTRAGATTLLASNSVRTLSPFSHALLAHAASPLAPTAAVPFALTSLIPAAAFHASPPAAAALPFNERVANVNELLKHTTVIAFNDRVELLSETTPIIDHSELLDIAVETGMTRIEGEKLINNMASAGCLLRFHNAVYLRPSDVVDAMVAQLPLPTGEESKLVQQYEDKLQACKEELGPLEQEMSKVHRSANSSARFYLWAGLFLLVFQLTAFIRLTFWELSWDVMEPIGFFVQLGTGILAYTWFMFYGMDMSYDNMYNKFYGTARSKKIRGMESLVEKHQELVKHMRLYEKFLRWAKK